METIREERSTKRRTVITIILVRNKDWTTCIVVAKYKKREHSLYLSMWKVKVIKTYREAAVVRDEVTKHDHAVFVVIDCKLHILIDAEVLLRSRWCYNKTNQLKIIMSCSQNASRECKKALIMIWRRSMSLEAFGMSFGAKVIDWDLLTVLIVFKMSVCGVPEYHPKLRGPD